MLRPTRKIRSLRGAGFSGPTRPPRPDQIDRYPNQNYLQALSRGLRLVEQENKHDTDRRKYVDRRDKRVTEGAIRPPGIPPVSSQHKNPYYRQHVEKQRGKHNVIEQVAVEVSVGHYSGRIHVPSAH